MLIEEVANLETLRHRPTPRGQSSLEGSARITFRGIRVASRQGAGTQSLAGQSSQRVVERIGIIQVMRWAGAKFN